MSTKHHVSIPPLSRSGFFFSNNEFYVEIDGHHRHTRCDPVTLYHHLTYIPPSGPVLTKSGAVSKRQPAPHVDPPAHFYRAQLVHYGLKPLKTKEAAKKALLDAFQGVGVSEVGEDGSGVMQLSVPSHISLLEGEMKQEYRLAMQKAEKEYKEEQKRLEKERKKEEKAKVKALESIATAGAGPSRPKKQRVVLKETGATQSAASSGIGPIRTKQTAIKGGRKKATNSARTEEKSPAKPSPIVYDIPDDHEEGLGSDYAMDVDPEDWSQEPYPSQFSFTTIPSQMSFDELEERMKEIPIARLHAVVARFMRVSGEFADEIRREVAGASAGAGANVIGSGMQFLPDEATRKALEEEFKRLNASQGMSRLSLSSSVLTRSDIQGTYTLTVPSISSNWPDSILFHPPTITVAVSSTNAHLWCSFNFGIYEGFVRSVRGPPEAQNESCVVKWKGRDTNEGVMEFQDDQTGFITFLPDGRIRGTLRHVGAAGDCMFHGMKTSNGSVEGNVDWKKEVKKWKREYRGINERSYGIANVRRWGRWKEDARPDPPADSDTSVDADGRDGDDSEEYGSGDEDGSWQPVLAY
ncbi:hypothetical protein AX16_010071 [Volvariella volvacea WC 439]|nr:hypothetical protein AX16_010071 [Volvariella volvacea WC 439]